MTSHAGCRVGGCFGRRAASSRLAASARAATLRRPGGLPGEDPRPLQRRHGRFAPVGRAATRTACGAQPQASNAGERAGSAPLRAKQQWREFTHPTTADRLPASSPLYAELFAVRGFTHPPLARRLDDSSPLRARGLVAHGLMHPACASRVDIGLRFYAPSSSRCSRAVSGFRCGLSTRSVSWSGDVCAACTFAPSSSAAARD